MENWIISIMDQFGYLGIFLLITLENLFPPIPSEVILSFGGFMTTHTDLSFVGVVLVSTVGSVTGAIMLYGIGRLIDLNHIEKIVEKWGKVLRLTKEDIHKADDWFAKYGGWTVFFCRFVPLIRSLISLPAGMVHMNFGMFLILTTLGTFVWNFVLVRIGAAVGGSWGTIVGFMDVYSNAVYAFLGLLVLVFIFLFVRTRLLVRK